MARAEQGNSRILFLDGLRCLAVSAVLLFHYFSRWTQPWNSENLYPYGDAFWRYFRLGFYGVPLFFIISGFVITLSLYRCNSLKEFAVRRFARLWPTMLLCSLLTLTVTSVIPNRGFHVSPVGLLPSLTFIEPHIFNSLFHTLSFDWIDGSYWSLFAEVRFYLFAALLFFWKPRRFSESFFYFSLMVVVCEFTVLALHLGKLVYLIDLAFAAERLPWFLMGVSLYFFIEGDRKAIHYCQFAVGLLSVLGFSLVHRSWEEAIMAIVIPAIFICGAYLKPFTWLLSRRSIATAGAASYSLYLIHQSIGNVLIERLSDIWHFTGKLSCCLAILVASMFFVVARYIYRFWEQPLNRLLVGLLAKRDKPAMNPQEAEAGLPSLS